MKIRLYIFLKSMMNMPTTMVSRLIMGVIVVAYIIPNTLAFSSFSDVSASHPNTEAIAYVQAKGIVSGYEDGTYRPNQQINRAEFAKILEESIPDATNGVDICFPDPDHKDFADIRNEDWFWIYTCMQKGRGIVSGYPDGTFRPANQINFVEAAKMLYGANHLDDRGILLPSNIGGQPWFRSYVTFLEERHAIPMSITHFDQPITRGEMAEMIYRVQANITTKSSLTYDQISQSQTGEPISPAVEPSVQTNGFIRYNAPGFSIEYPSGWQLRPRSGEMSFGVEFFPAGVTIPTNRRYGDLNAADVPQLISVHIAMIGDIKSNTYDERFLALPGGSDITIDGKKAKTSSISIQDGTQKTMTYSMLATPPTTVVNDGSYDLNDVFLGIIVSYSAPSSLYKEDIAKKLQLSFHENLAALGSLDTEAQTQLSIQSFIDLYGEAEPQYLPPSFHQVTRRIQNSSLITGYKCTSGDLSAGENPPFEIIALPISQDEYRESGITGMEQIYAQGLSPNEKLERVTVSGTQGVYAPWSNKPGIIAFWKDGFRISVNSYFCDVSKDDLLKIAESMKMIKKPIHASWSVPVKTTR